MTAKEEILTKVFEPSPQDCTTPLQDLQLAITLNPHISKIMTAMDIYAEQKAWESFKAAKELMWGPMTPYGEEFARKDFEKYWEENNK